MATSPASNDDAPLPSFEEAIEELETIVHDLEEGRLDLADSLQKYEHGVKLMRQCYVMLEGAQRRIELLSGVDAEGNPITQPMVDPGAVSLDQKAQQRSRRRTAAPGSTEGEQQRSDPCSDV